MRLCAAKSTKQVARPLVVSSRIVAKTKFQSCKTNYVRPSIPAVDIANIVYFCHAFECQICRSKTPQNAPSSWTTFGCLASSSYKGAGDCCTSPPTGAYWNKDYITRWLSGDLFNDPSKSVKAIVGILPATGLHLCPQQRVLHRPQPVSPDSPY